MIPEEVQLRLMTYFFDVSVSDDFHNKLGDTLNEVIFQHEFSNSSVTDDELVQIGVQLINEYLDI